MRFAVFVHLISNFVETRPKKMTERNITLVEVGNQIEKCGALFLLLLGV